MQRFTSIKQILEEAVSGEEIGAHGNFWRDLTRDEFLETAIFGRPLLAKRADQSFDPEESNLVKALEGRAPFGKDIGTPGAAFRRMPAGRPPVPREKIAAIRQWIEDDCPDDGSSEGGGSVVTWERVKTILDGAIARWKEVNGRDPDLTGIHGATFRWETKAQLAEAEGFGFRLIDPASVGNGKAEETNLIIALRTGVPPFPRMPANGPFVPDAEIAELARWIDAGIPD
jgi:hypothetical protein